MAHVVALVLALVAQAAGREGTVTGTLTLNGVTVQLTHVYASAQPGFFDKRAEDTRILLSDISLDDETRGDVFALRDRARDNSAHVIEVVIDASGAPISGEFYGKEFDGMVSATGMHRFTRERMDRTTIAGSLVVDPPDSFMGVTFQYTARFSAPIPRPPTATEIAAALKSPPALAAGAYLTALRSGRLASFVATMTSAAAADYAGAAGIDNLTQLRSDVPVDSRVVSLEPQADGSTLAKVEGHENGMVIGYTLKMVLEGNAWKVDK